MFDSLNSECQFFFSFLAFLIMKIDPLIHLVCEFGNSMTNRTEMDDNRSAEEQKAQTAHTS